MKKKLLSSLLCILDPGDWTPFQFQNHLFNGLNLKFFCSLIAGFFFVCSNFLSINWRLSWNYHKYIWFVDSFMYDVRYNCLNLRTLHCFLYLPLEKMLRWQIETVLSLEHHLSGSIAGSEVSQEFSNMAADSNVSFKVPGKPAGEGANQLHIFVLWRQCLSLNLFPELSIETSKSFWNLKLIIINDTVNIEGRGRKKNTQNRSGLIYFLI